MKIIHTSDWHLGQNFFEYDRRDEHCSMVNQLVELVKCEKPDALVIAGDIYDIPAPGISVQKEFAEYMVALHTGCPHMKIICISGNHDSASRHEIYQTPWEALNVHMVGKADMENPENNIIQIGEKGWVVAVPYTNERFLDDDFFKSLEQVTKEKTGEKLPIVYVGHAAIRDSKIDYTGHQIQGMSMSSEKLTSDDFRFVGGIECTDIKELGDVYDYVALGHIHKAQTFNSGRARYCGSPLAVSFDEVRPGYEHGFSIVEIESHGAAPIITTKEVTTPCPLVNIPVSGFAAWSDAMKELKGFPKDIKAYIRLNILLKGNELLPFDAKVQIQNALQGKEARHAVTNPIREEAPSTENGKSGIVSLTISELNSKDPRFILESYAKSKGQIFDAEFEEMFEIILNTINDTDYEN